MASSFTPWGPSTGPGSYYNTVQFVTFQANQQGVTPGIGYASNLGPNNTPDPGPPAADSTGILLENSWNEFIELENGSGWLIQE